MKKVIFTLFMLAGGGVILSTLMSSGGSTGGQVTYEQAPPIPLNYYVQKLPSTSSTSSQNMILRVKYFADSTLPDEIDLFEGGSLTRTLKDDGVFPDITAGDFTYATYYYQTITSFLADISALESNMLTKGGVFNWEGHDGEFIPYSSSNLFNVAGFVNGEEIPIYTPILNAGNCDEYILKQNSLFITDLSVVEDPARTYNVLTNTGNYNGVWTFGQLMKNIANTTYTGVSAKDFIKAWVRTWTVDQSIGSFAGGNSPQAIPYNNVPARGKAVLHLIAPWLTKAYLALGTPLAGNTDFDSDWETLWDDLPETSILRNAPFKLMAIVNRLDVRGNLAYNPNVANAGETRFIFTLIDPLTGMPPIHDDIIDLNNGSTFMNTNGAIDWVGMNVILEYGNPFTDNCQLQSFAQQWYDLSSYPLGTGGVPNSDYNDALELITNQVTDNNVAEGKNVNGSAINQIRTNEKIFDPVVGIFDPELWETPDWEMRQFELEPGDNGTGFLLSSVVSNTPVDERPGMFPDLYSYNSAQNISLNNASNFLNTWNMANNSWISLIEWIYGPNGTSINRIRASLGMLNIPEGYLGGSARVYKEMTHYFGLNWQLLPTAVKAQFNFLGTVDQNNALAKKIRHQISINTCQGCHAGETKTNFTHIYPRGYGQEANYWDAIPSVVNNLMKKTNNPSIIYFDNSIDNRFKIHSVTTHPEVDNLETTYNTYAAAHKYNLDFTEKTTNNYNQVVSPFLTGRKYSNVIGNNWEDDELNNLVVEGEVVGQPDDINNFADDFTHGLFYSNDPSNESTLTIGNGLGAGLGGPFPQKHTAKWGVNDLERRKDDLCIFLSQSCNFPSLVDLMQKINKMPLPLHSH